MNACRHRFARLLCVALACVVSVALGTAGCSTTPKPKEKTPPVAAGQGAKAHFSAYNHLKQRARWLPADTQLVGVGDASYLWEFFGELIPPPAPGDHAAFGGGPTGERAQAGVKARAQALEAKLSDVWSKRVQLDLTSATSVVVGAGEQRMALILDGQFQPPPGAEKMTINGFQVYYLKKPFEGAFRSEFLQLMSQEIDLYMVMLEKPAGVAIFIDRQGVQNATARVRKGMDSLTGTDRLAEFKDLMDMTDGARLVVAGAGVPPEEQTPPGQPPSSVESAEQVILGIGSSVQASFRGSKAALDDIDNEVQQDITQFRQRMQAMQASYRTNSLLEASAAALVAYLGEGYINAVQKKRGQGTLTYTLPLPEDRPAAALAGLLGLGLTDWLRVRGTALIEPPHKEAPAEPTSDP